MKSGYYILYIVLYIVNVDLKVWFGCPQYTNTSDAGFRYQKSTKLFIYWNIHTTCAGIFRLKNHCTVSLTL